MHSEVDSSDRKDERRPLSSTAPAGAKLPATELSASMSEPSPFLRARARYQPRYPEILADVSRLTTKVHKATVTTGSDDLEQLARTFPRLYGQTVLEFQKEAPPKPPTAAPRATAKALATHSAHTVDTIGIVLSGGPAPGGHNVIWGIYDALKQVASDAKVIGFCGGPAGILEDQSILLSDEVVECYRNSGGFDMLGSGRAKIETTQQFQQCQAVLERHAVDALIIIGGDDSNTNAALLAEHLLSEGSPIRIVGVPKTIDGDLKNAFVETSFGFDTAVRVYAELIANIAKDALSAKKYYHFIRLMGRSASHITLEAALQTQPNIVLISEEIAAEKKTLRELVEDLGAVIKERAAAGKNYGIVLVPEGVVEFIPEVKALIAELNTILGEHKSYIDTLSGFTAKSEYINRKLGRDTSYTFASLPIDIQRQLLMDRDPHGNVIVSSIETEKLLIELLNVYLGEEGAEGRFAGKFGSQRHFLGYEGRCAAPTNFDADYAYALGRTATALAVAGVSGYMAVVTNLTGERDDWQALGVPLVSMMTVEARKGQSVPVIRKGLVELDGKAYRYLQSQRPLWAAEDCYRFAGSIQYFGPSELCDKVPCSLALENDRMQQVAW